MIKTCEICGGQITTNPAVFRPCVCSWQWGDILMDERRTLVAENKRYREALERIVWQNGLSALLRIAREALDTDDASRKAVEKYFRERGHDV